MTDTEKTDDPLAALADEIGALRDLFQRRLLEDKAKNRLYEELFEQVVLARDGLTNQYLTPIVLETLLIVDRIDASGLASKDDFTRSLRDELIEVWRRRGLEMVDTEGPFDPSIHEAVGLSEPEEGIEEGTLVKVRRAGYYLGRRLVRPAQVIVAGGTSPSEELPVDAACLDADG